MIDAEGNGDSISAAIQAERIALLTNLLTTERTAQGAAAAVRNSATHVVTGPPAVPSNRNMQQQLHARGAAVDLSSAQVQMQAQVGSCFEGLAIYQTSGQAHVPPSHVYRAVTVSAGHGRALSGSVAGVGVGVGVGVTTGGVNGMGGGLERVVGAMGALALDDTDASSSSSRNLLPSFLHDFVESPSLSPTTTTSSADFSWEEYGEMSGASSVVSHQTTASSQGHGQSQGAGVHQNQHALKQGLQGHGKVMSGSTTSFALARDSIWKMDGLESKLMSCTTTTPAPSAPVFHAPADGRACH